jgi:hypothetical protein
MMVDSVLPLLLFFATASLAISWSFGTAVNRKGKWVRAIALVAALFAVKLVRTALSTEM